MARKYGMKHPFAIGLWYYMKANGIPSYYALSQRTPLPITTAQEIFTPEYKGPSHPTLCTLSKAFEFTPGDFLRKIEKLYQKNKYKRNS